MADVYTALRVETPAEQVDRQMETCRVIAERREQLLRLLRNADFKALVMRFYLVEEAARMVQMSGHVGVSAQDQKGFLEMAQATGHLKRFLDVVERQGEQAVADLMQYTANYDELVTPQPEDE